MARSRLDDDDGDDDGSDSSVRLGRLARLPRVTEFSHELRDSLVTFSLLRFRMPFITWIFSTFVTLPPIHRRLKKK